MDIYVAKGIVLLSLFILTFVFSMLPSFLIKKLNDAIDPSEHSRYARIISLLSCFAAGVFMATGLLDLFPEVQDNFKVSSISELLITSFPLAEFAVATGFFLVLIMEQIVLDFKERSAAYVLPSEESRQIRRGSIEGIRDDVSYENPEPVAYSSVRSVMLLAALSLHSLFEGIAIGLQPNVQALLQIYTAVILHKVIIAFSLGLNLVQTTMKIKTIAKYSVMFCITTPLGIGIAMSLEEFGHNVDSSITNGILQGLACGTFFYVTFFEVLPHELNQEGDRLLKVLAVLIGFAFVSAVLLLEPNSSAQRKSIHGTRKMYVKHNK